MPWRKTLHEHFPGTIEWPDLLTRCNQHLGEFGITLKAGEVILSGSLVPLEPVVAGDEMRVDIGGIGSASVRFT